MKRSKPASKRGKPASTVSIRAEARDFAEVVNLIQTARQRALAAVNTALIELYWQVGQYLSHKLETAVWGEGVVERLARHITTHHPEIRGFTRPNLFRMRQFYETYRDDEKVSPLVRQLQVGGRDFFIDLLFFHRVLCCLISLEVKIAEFQPEHLGKLEFYLEALDRDWRKPNEGPSIGVLLCATKDSEVVEYALSRALSTALVAEYKSKLPDKKLLRAKLHEFYALSEAAAALKAEAKALPRPKTKKRKPKGGAR
ncbi:MAG: PDDEXK nuclease domain-containing protein [Acidobacteria bacterium]|nr:PDDEXK nuclease domain-containing protein [Acidobacteriota bacterium]